MRPRRKYDATRAAFGAEVTGIDLSRAAIAFCRRMHTQTRAVFEVGDAENLTIDDQSVDVVFNLESSHSYPDLPVSISEVHRVLRTGGWLLHADILRIDQWKLLRPSTRRVKKVRMPIDQAPVDAIRAIAATLISCPCVRALLSALITRCLPRPESARRPSIIGLLTAMRSCLGECWVGSRDRASPCGRHRRGEPPRQYPRRALPGSRRDFEGRLGRSHGDPGRRDRCARNRRATRLRAAPAALTRD